MTAGEHDNRDVQVLVVGAGPTGLALAAELRAYGVSFRIIDRLLDRVHESRALAVQPRTLEVLARHGLAQPLIEYGNTAVQLRMHAGDRTVALRLFDIGIADTAYPYLLFVSQAETERLLGEHLHRHEVRIERGTELITLHTDQGKTACRLRHSDGRMETVTATYVVGCDGAHSFVRQQAGIDFEGHAYPQTFLLADLDADGLERDVVHTFMGRAGMLFFFPLGRPATWRMLAMRAPADPDTPVTLGVLQEIVDRYTGVAVRLRDPVWMTDFRLHNRGATAYRAGGVFLAGDAAHIHSPAGAQGMNTGIQDAVNLGWKLALACRGTTAPGLLDSYQAERAPIGRAVLRFTNRAFTIATSDNRLLGLARTQLAPRLAPAVLGLRPARRLAFRTVSQLRVRYRESPLTAAGGHRHRRGPKAGDRLPDASIIQAGRSTTLHDAVAAPGFHLLLCGPATAWPDDDLAVADHVSDLVHAHRLSRVQEPGVLYDRDGTALHRLGLPADTAGWYLIRPDGHIACRAAGADLTEAHAYLDRWLPPHGSTEGPVT